MSSGSGVTFGVAPEDVHAVADQCQATADEIAAQLSSLKTYVGNLETQWSGQAPATFNTLMADWDIYASMLHQALTGIGQGLHTNGWNYAQSELADANSPQQVNAALPGAPAATPGALTTAIS